MAAFDRHLPCDPWVTPADVRGCCTKVNCADPADPVTDEEIQESIDFASEILYLATAQQFGVCTAELRPCVESECGCYAGWYGGTEVYSANELGYGGMCGCSCCDGYKRIDLGLWPIQSVDSIDIAGTTITDQSLFHIEDYRFLAWTPQAPNYLSRSWPACQDRDRPKGAPNTFTIDVTYGIPVPAAGKRAARLLACEYLALCRGEICALPNGVRGITKQGVQFDMTDPAELRKLGLFGINAVDVFLSFYNPNKLQSAAFVYSPDLATGRLRQWT